MSPKVAGCGQYDQYNHGHAGFCEQAHHWTVAHKSTHNFSKLIKAQSTQKHDSYHLNDW